MVGETLLHYRILERAGAGAMGEVYRAEDQRLRRTVALKLLPERLAADPALLDRFHREASTLAQLEHPNIVTIYSIDQDGDRPFLTMAWVEGRTLEEAMPDGGLPLPRFLEIGVALADAVAAAHAKGITHRDLKPANVMVGADDCPQVLDFGLAKSSGIDRTVDSATEPLTENGMIIGSLPYMAPEQVRGERIDPRSDVFALGTMLYEMATGHRPFQGASAGDLISSILRDSPPPVDQVRTDLPRQLGRILRRCLHKDPERRYESARGLRNALEDLRTEIKAGETRERITVAVLPFVDMSPEGDQEYFCAGIAEEIVGALTHLDSICVVARSSSFQFRDQSLDLREIGSRLNAQAILDGSVRKAGDRVRISVQLVNVADGFHLWSDRYDRELVDIFAIQDDIAQRIAEALELTLSPDEKESLRKPVADIEAYDAYLRGRRYGALTTQEGFDRALEMFHRAIDIDPDYAPAWAGIADIHCWRYGWFGACDDNLDEAERASLKAIELAPDSAEARASRGYVLSLRGESGAAEEEFRRATEINPHLFEPYWYWSRDLFTRGDFAEAAELMEKAAQVAPHDYQALLLAHNVLLALGEAERAAEAGREGLARARRALELNPRDARALYLGTFPTYSLGRPEEAFANAERALAIDPDSPSTLYNVGCFYALTGQREEALDCLERASALNFGFKAWFEHDSDLDSLREEPRFQAILERMEGIEGSAGVC